MIIQNVSRKIHILSFLRRKDADTPITLNPGQSVDLAAMRYKDDEIKNLPQLQMLIQSGELKILTAMPEITQELIDQAEKANKSAERDRVIEKVNNSYAVTLIEAHAQKAKDNKDEDLYNICKDRLNAIYGVGVSTI
jgi:hypothetical protein